MPRPYLQVAGLYAALDGGLAEVIQHRTQSAVLTVEVIKPFWGQRAALVELSLIHI